MKQLVSIAVVAVLVATGVAFQQDQESGRLMALIKKSQRDRLEGLKAVRVVAVWGTTPFGEQSKSLQTAVELHLRKTGVPVVSADQQLIGRPFLQARVLPQLNTIDLILKEDARLERDLNKQAEAIVWESESPYSDLRSQERLRAALLELVDEFANDYLAANPQRPSPSSSRPATSP